MTRSPGIGYLPVDGDAPVDEELLADAAQALEEHPLPDPFTIAGEEALHLLLQRPGVLSILRRRRGLDAFDRAASELGQGGTLRQAARLASLRTGIDEDTLRRWERERRWGTEAGDLPHDLVHPRRRKEAGTP